MPQRCCWLLPSVSADDSQLSLGTSLSLSTLHLLLLPPGPSTLGVNPLLPQLCTLQVQEKPRSAHRRHHLGSAQRGASAGASLSIRVLFKTPSPWQHLSSSLQLGRASPGWYKWLCDLPLPSLHFPLTPSYFYSRRDKVGCRPGFAAGVSRRKLTERKKNNHKPIDKITQIPC